MEDLFKKKLMEQTDLHFFLLVHIIYNNNITGCRKSKKENHATHSLAKIL